MELLSPPFWILPFRDRQVGVSEHSFRGLVVFDPKGQRNLLAGKIRIYSARAHKLLVLFEEKTKRSLKVPSTDRRAWLTVYSYRAFLNPSLKRPSAWNFAAEERDFGEPDDYADDLGSSETAQILEELSEDQESWARSEEVGWFYDDTSDSQQ